VDALGSVSARGGLSLCKEVLPVSACDVSGLAIGLDSYPIFFVATHLLWFVPFGYFRYLLLLPVMSIYVMPASAFFWLIGATDSPAFGPETTRNHVGLFLSVFWGIVGGVAGFLIDRSRRNRALR